MRKLMWFTLGFGSVCAFCAYAWVSEGLLTGAMVCVLLSVLFLLCSQKWSSAKIAAVILLGCGAGLGWFHVYHSSYLAPVMALDGNLAQVKAFCADYGVCNDRGTMVDGYVVFNGKPYQVRFYVKGDIPIEPGDLLDGVFKFRITTPGGQKDSTYHKGNGIFLLAYQKEDAQLQKATSIPWYFYHSKLRKDLKEIIDGSFPADTAPFAKALLLGDRSGIDYETTTAFKVSGIMHIIAVSGLHVSILFALVYTLCLKRRYLTAIFGISSLVLFAAVAGFTPSVTRACIMQILVILALLLGKEYDAPTALAFACLTMLIVNPLTITSVSFQLSVSAMAGIMLFYKEIDQWLREKLGVRKICGFRKLRIWLAGSVAVSISAMVLTVPLTAMYFGTVSLIGVITNLLTLWAVNIIFYGVMVVCLISLLSGGLAYAIAWGISWLIRYVLVAARLMSRFPLAAVYTKSIYIVVWLVFCYVLLAAFLLMKKKRPMIFCCGIVLGLSVAIGASWIEPMLDTSRLMVLDVGQGQCLILQSEGKTFLVDCGGDHDERVADLAAETLFSMGIFRLDGLIATHFDRDHVGAIPYLLTRMDTDMLIIPDYQDEYGVGDRLEQMVNSCIRVNQNLLLRFGATKMAVFGPTVTDSDNESGLCVLFQGPNCDILITGDRSAFGERLLLRQMDFEPVDVLVAGHHGSKYSTCDELLDAVCPQIAVISVGENFYGHPAKEALDRLQNHGCSIYRTDLNGTITIRR